MRRELALNFDLIGDLERNTDAGAAATAYAEALAIRRAVTAEQPDEAVFQVELAATLEKVGSLQAMAGDGTAAVATMAEIIATRRLIAALLPDDQVARVRLADDLERFGNLHVVMGDPPAALAAWQDNLQIRHTLADALPDDQDVRRKLAGAHANVAFGQLFAGDHAGAEASSRQALALVPGGTVFETNLAHALMMQERIAEADGIYLGNRGTDLGGRRWEDVVRADFDRLRRNGVSHPHMDEILRRFDEVAAGTAP
jgi:tetratricopeptide (TPR) repeat protein